MNTVDVLREAKAFLSDESRWLRTGGFTKWDDGQRVAHCAVGAIIHSAVKLRENHWPAMDALNGVVEARAGIYNWNDHEATHADLIAAFDRAILSLAGEGIASEPQPATTAANGSESLADAPSPVEVGGLA